MISAAQQAELFAAAVLEEDCPPPGGWQGHERGDPWVGPAPVTTPPPAPDPGPALRLSKSGACARELAYRFHGHAGIPDSDASRFRMDLGHVFEARVIELMTADGYMVQSRQLDVSIDVGGVTVTGHIDGLVETPRRAARIRLGDHEPIPLPPMLLEVKSMGWTGFKAFGESFAWHPYFASYRAQASTYLAALGLSHALVVAVVRNDRDTAESVRTGDLNWTAEVYQRDDALVAEVRERFARVLRSKAPEPELRELGPDSRGVLPKPCTWCPFRDACWGGVDRAGRPKNPPAEIF